MARETSCLARVTTGVAVGGAVGGAVGAVYGTYEAIRYKVCICCDSELRFDGAWKMKILPESTSMNVPGLLKIRYIGQTTLGSAAIFGLFLGAGSLIHCGKSY
ncbi:reactive oxygen species modulator 1 [Citrus sinensis]|nr:reactive oxygen species modulator 1 [Citrus sinensis]